MTEATAEGRSAVDYGALLREWVDRLLGSELTAEQAAEQLGEVVEREDKYWRIRPHSGDLDDAYVRFENLGHADDVMTIIELMFGQPWKTSHGQLEERFGDQHEWLDHSHPERPRSLVFDVAKGEGKGILSVRVDPPIDEEGGEYVIRSAVMRRIYGPRRA